MHLDQDQYGFSQTTGRRLKQEKMIVLIFLQELLQFSCKLDEQDEEGQKRETRELEKRIVG